MSSSAGAASSSQAHHGRSAIAHPFALSTTARAANSRTSKVRTGGQLRGGPACRHGASTIRPSTNPTTPTIMRIVPTT
jgi:hypothetical protein